MDSILFETPDNPLPGKPVAGFFDGKDGARIRYAMFRGEGSIAMGTVVLLQGRNESIEKYYETIGELTAQGLWVATFDWRGQGGSSRLLDDPAKGHVERFSDYGEDLGIFLETIVLPDGRLPFFLVAHSMGALVALAQAPYLENRIERMVLAAPFVALAGQRFSQGKIEVFARIATALGLGGRTFQKPRGAIPFAGNIYTSDERRFARNAAICSEHPELAVGPPTARWLNEVLGAINRVGEQSHLTRIRIPTVMLCATRDALVPRAALARLARRFRAARLIEIDNARHELFQEADVYRAQAMAALSAFIPGSDATAPDFAA
ncbi:alpha/beta hydrolase [Rhizobium sp. TRM95111]|uniref:alpha/beta fold hydrolase n=1 Tax=Rhizobium alarense TaxID=2846851 RepID=UPI001F37F3D8|nr:alpha/beta hydrolase [Rhizobium alarense]MCF3640354.1 alpha/beta hydrolase [Rhizobium alarense]